MPNFVLPSGVTTPFGSNEFLRSTEDVKRESWTFATSSLPAFTVDGAAHKLLQRGVIVATITAVGADQGKVGPFQAGATDGRQTVANIVGINDSFVPWQLDDGDKEIAVVYSAVVLTARLLELNAGGTAWIAAQGSTKTGLVAVELCKTIVLAT